MRDSPINTKREKEASSEIGVDQFLKENRHHSTNKFEYHDLKRSSLAGDKVTGLKASQF
jgi:hypothetical protein